VTFGCGASTAAPPGLRSKCGRLLLRTLNLRGPVGKRWVEHIEWLEPLFNERLRIADDQMHVPARPGLGFSLSDQARALTAETTTVGLR
jgi:L-alanine-DL-glutamate epimerase-like enolase superfamily enzyme